jgi:hypothetical protein
MEQVTQQNAALVGQVAAAAHSLKDQVSVLREAVGRSRYPRPVRVGGQRCLQKLEGEVGGYPCSRGAPIDARQA